MLLLQPLFVLLAVPFTPGDQAFGSIVRAWSAGAAPHDMMRFVTWSEAYHESMNDHGREKVIQDVLAWLDAALVV